MIERQQLELMIYQHAMSLTVFAAHTPKSALALARKLAALAFEDALPPAISGMSKIDASKSNPPPSSKEPPRHP